MSKTNISDMIKRLSLDYEYIREDILSDEEQYRKVIDDIWSIYDAVIAESYNKQKESINKVSKIKLIDDDKGGIIFTRTENGVEIFFPRLLPNKKKLADKNGDIELFKRRLHAAAKDFSEKPDGHIFFTSKTDITIHQFYKRKSGVKDYDNCDIKQVIDTITMFFMPDDSPLEYNLHMYGDLDGKENYTIISIEKEKQ